LNNYFSQVEEDGHCTAESICNNTKEIFKRDLNTAAVNDFILKTDFDEDASLKK